jgi:hypothetical protein
MTIGRQVDPGSLKHDNDLRPERLQPLTAPHGTMHSFDSNHNKIAWRLEVRGDVGRTLPVEWNYRILVLPLPQAKDRQ